MTQTDREYAEALFMLATEDSDPQKYLDELTEVRNLTQENPDYIEFLASPAIPLQERLTAIDQAFEGRLSEYTVSFLKLLCENGRIRDLYGCIDEYERLTRELSNRAVANVVSAIALSDEQKKKICQKLETLTGKGIDATYTVDESLIGGMKIEIEGKTYDGSIKRRLSDVKDVIIR